jgi:hypothetical protein
VADTLEWKPQRTIWTAQRRSATGNLGETFKLHVTNKIKISFFLFRFTDHLINPLASYEMVRVTENRQTPTEKERGLFSYLWDEVEFQIFSGLLG